MPTNEKMDELITAINNLTAEIREIGDVLRATRPENSNDNAKTYRYLCANSTEQKWRIDEENLGGVSGCPSDIWPFAKSLCRMGEANMRACEETCRKCWDQPCNG